MKKISAKVIQPNRTEKDIQIDYSDIISPVDESVGKNDDSNVFALTMKLLQPIIRIGNTGATSRNLIHWKENGVLLDAGYSNDVWARFNYLEYVWLQTVKELRDFGMSLEIIKKVKDDMIYPQRLRKQSENKFTLQDFKSDKDNHNCSLDELKLMRQFYIFMDVSNDFSNIISECIINRVNIKLLVLKNGTAYYHCEGEDFIFQHTDDRYDESKSIKLNSLKFENYLTVSLTGIIRDYILNNKQSLQPSALPILSAQENELLDHIRRNDIEQITIKYQNRKINLIEVTENLTTKDLASRYSDHIMKDGYQEITYKTESGKMVNFRRTTKIKI